MPQKGPRGSREHLLYLIKRGHKSLGWPGAKVTVSERVSWTCFPYLDKFYKIRLKKKKNIGKKRHHKLCQTNQNSVKYRNQTISYRILAWETFPGQFPFSVWVISLSEALAIGSAYVYRMLPSVPIAVQILMATLVIYPFGASRWCGMIPVWEFYPRSLGH